MQSFVKTAVRNLKKNASYLKKQSFEEKAVSECKCHNPIYYMAGSASGQDESNPAL